MNPLVTVDICAEAETISWLIDLSIARKLIGNYFGNRLTKNLIVPGSQMQKFATFLGLALQ